MMKSLQRNKTCRESVGFRSFRVNLDGAGILLFIYIGKCWPCFFGSGERTAPPSLTLGSFGLQSLDVGPCFLGIGGCQPGKS